MNNPIQPGIRLAGTALAVVLGLGLAAPAVAEVQASDGWVRATAPGAKVAAAYLTLRNTGDEDRKLLKIVSPVSDEVSIHRTSITETGVARMWPMALLAVDAGTTLRLEASGLHVMLNALKTPLVAGQKVPLTMKFDGGEAEFTLVLEVRPLTAGADGHAHH
ncbi:MAG TPA: copper chaperone PCu(A)C [Steroidobacteraceae bacterium]|nr:copper chaperone PCu(A)C [Steroidobacteraceae bacterium]